MDDIFLETLEATIRKLEERYAKIKKKKSYLNNKQKEILDFVKNNEPVKISDLVLALTDYSSYTLKKDIRYLLDEKLTKKTGKGRDTIYILNDQKDKS